MTRLLSFLMILLVNQGVSLAWERCGAANNGNSCKTSRCCSKYGYCGDIEDFCLEGCQSAFGKCGMDTTPAPQQPLTSPPLMLTPSSAPLPISTDGTCGNGKRCPNGFCCSKFGFCGSSSLHCGDGCQPGSGVCPSKPPVPAQPTPAPTKAPVPTPAPAPTPAPNNNLPVTTDGSCGADSGTRCPDSFCCSRFGFCGSSPTHCGVGCQSGFGRCSVPTTAPPSFCGPQNGNKTCPNGLCCGSNGGCGTGDAFCGKASCQPRFGSCDLEPLPAVPAKSFPSIYSPYVLVEASSFSNYGSIAQQYKIRWMTMAFVIANNGIPYWGYSWPADGSDPNDKVMNEVKGLRKIGADAIASFGGAAGDELATVIHSDMALLDAYQSVISGYNFKFMDFDIEGASLADVVTNQRRNRVLAHLQRNNPDVLLSFTLPVLPSGLTDIGLNILRDAKAAGVRIDAVNIMAMDYGPGGIDMGLAAINAIISTKAQLKALGLSSCIGIIPMIGVNDIQSEIFRQDDAKEVLAFASNPQNGVCITSFWSLDRDNTMSTRINQAPFEFTKIFAGVQ